VYGGPGGLVTEAIASLQDAFAAIRR
jgi:hypothetical protein